jgi:hypothetical protein
MRKFFNKLFGKSEKGELPKAPKLSFPDTEEGLDRELQDGTVIAEELVRHVHKMGANGCNLYLEYSEGETYCVSVKPVQEQKNA